MTPALEAYLNTHHIYHLVEGQNEWDPTKAGWWFSDETEYLNGPYESAIVALMQLDLYVVWLEGYPTFEPLNRLVPTPNFINADGRRESDVALAHYGSIDTVLAHWKAKHILIDDPRMPA